jgi:hypothetical protein
MAEPRSRSLMSNPGMMGSGDAALQALKVPPHSVEAEQSLLGGLLSEIIKNKKKRKTNFSNKKQ